MGLGWRKAEHAESAGQMPWLRRGQRRYFFKTVCVGGRRVHVYVGRGAAAEQALQEIERRRAEREARRDELQADMKRYSEGTEDMAAFSRAVDLLVGGTLISMGYHHKHRQWRLRRNHVTPNPRCANGQTVSA